jgi:DNA-binding GntR family transcriptional regulator
LDEHKGLVDAIETGDEQLVIRRLEEHMRDALHRLNVVMAGD